MSLIGTLEKIDIKSVLRRVELHSKTGLFVVKQDAQWIEMYFRDGRLMWVGPAHIQISLGEWFIQTGVLTMQVWQEMLLGIGSTQPGEMRTALTLMDLGYVNHDELRTWATQRAQRALKTLSSWATGEMYFEDNIAPSSDYLLVALSIISLFTESVETVKPITPAAAPVALTVSQPMAAISRPAPVVIGQTTPVPDKHVSNAPTLMEASQFFSSHAPKILADPLPSPDEVMANWGIIVKESEPPATVATLPTSSPLHHIPSALHLISDAPEGEPTQLMPSASLSSFPATPNAIKPIDVSFMQPDMLLVPADLSALHEQNFQLQLTPEQWRLLTLINGQTSLQAACQALRMSSEMVCRIAGELLTHGLIHVVSPHQAHVLQSQVQMHEAIRGDMGSKNMSITSGTVAVGQAPLSPSSDMVPQYLRSSDATQSQWGNGANGARFVFGRGWVTSPQPLQPSGPMVVDKTLAYTGK